MKKFAFFFVAFLLLCSCKSQKASADFTSGEPAAQTCPAGGECTFEVFKDKELLVKTDDTGRQYYKLGDAPGKMVVKYKYEKDTDARMQDAGYMEEVVFETDAALSNLNTSGAGMQKTKMLFGVMCFCRKAGYYTVKDGNMTYDGNRLLINIPEVTESQKIKTIDISFK